MLLYTTRPTAEQKRRRVTPIEYRIKQLQAELGYSKFDIKWRAICNDANKLKIVC